MPVPTTNVGLSDIAAEFGGTVPHALSEYYGAGSAPASGTIRFSHLAGESAGLSIKTHGKIIDTNTNATSYSGSLTASVAVGDLIVVHKVTGFGNYDYGTDTLQTSSVTYRYGSRIWSSPTYGHHRVFTYVATSAASSITLACNEGSTYQRQGMYCYAWLIGGGATYNDIEYAASTTATINTGEVGAVVTGSAYTDDAYAMPNFGTNSEVDYETTFDRQMHVWVGHYRQPNTNTTHSISNQSAASDGVFFSWVSS